MGFRVLDAAAREAASRLGGGASRREAVDTVCCSYSTEVLRGTAGGRLDVETQDSFDLLTGMSGVSDAA
jgi:hypothetical protein